MDCTAGRKTHKADREKLRRDRLNEQFVELGKVLDPDRPKNDKATVLGDTIQLLKGLTSQVSKLKDEYATLNEESRELSQEKNDLREEKASLKSDIENLNNQHQHQQQLRTMSPWTAMDHSVMLTPPSYPYPVPMPIPPSPIPMQSYPFFANQHSAVIPNPCSTFVPYLVPNNLVEQQLCPPLHPSNQSRVLGKQESRNNKSSKERKNEKHKDSNDVTTDRELRTPESSADQVLQDLSSGQRKSSKLSGKESGCTELSSLGRRSSSCNVQDSSSSNTVHEHKG